MQPLRFRRDTSKIEVAMQPSDESNYTPKEKATHPNIKKYVKDKYGVNVHTSYTAQVISGCVGLICVRTIISPRRKIQM